MVNGVISGTAEEFQKGSYGYIQIMQGLNKTHGKVVASGNIC